MVRLLASAPCRPLISRARQRGTDGRHHGRHVQGLDQVAEGAEFHGALYEVFVPVGREEQKGHCRLVAQASRKLESIETRHADIQQGQGRRFGHAQVQCLQAIARLDHVEAGLAQTLGEGEQHDPVVVGDEDPVHAQSARPWRRLVTTGASSRSLVSR